MAQDCEMQSNVEDTLVGAFMPRQLIDTLDLHSLVQETSRSELIRTVLNRWVQVREECDDLTTQQLIKDISYRQFEEVRVYFDLLSQEDWKDTLQHFLSQLRSKLEKRRLSEELIETILKEVNTLAENFIISASEEACREPSARRKTT